MQQQPSTAPVQQQEEPTLQVPQQQPVKTKEDLQRVKARATQYEKDLNTARDEILTAQREMKNIDSEVSDFHTKMAKSMHSLLKAFTEGFEAMDKAKEDELNEIESSPDYDELVDTSNKEKEAPNQDLTIEHFDKLNVGISNLESLTNGLKMTFDDQPDQQVQQ